MNLHNEIMNIPVTITMAELGLRQDLLPYTIGHRDARHAAAELALKADAEIESLRAQLEAANKLLSIARKHIIDKGWDNDY